MRLENLYPNFGRATPAEQAAYIASYRLKRAQDLAQETKVKAVSRSKTSSAKKAKIELSDDEKKIMKMLGLKVKDIEALRSVQQTGDDEESSTDDNKLLQESIYEEEED